MNFSNFNDNGWRDKSYPKGEMPGYDRNGPDNRRLPELEIIPVAPTPERKWDSIIPLIDINEVPEGIPGKGKPPEPMLH